jgi:hypothetical protein
MLTETATPDDSAGDQDWQRLWFMLVARPCTAIAVVGTDSSTDVERVARHLASVGAQHESRPVRVVSAVGVGVSSAQDIARRLSDASVLGELLLVPCDPLRHNPAMFPILRATSGVVIVVRLGRSLLASVRATVDSVGRDRVLASVAIG